jgi:hypothetical protein
VQDDAWLRFGEGTLDSRLAELERLRVDIVRFTVRWDEIARERPASARDHRDPAYDWSSTDPLLRGLHRRGIGALITLWGTPAWANGGRAANWAPTTGTSFANFAHAAAGRYPWVRAWTVWNEPNQRRWLRPTSPRVYVERLLNPAYAQIRAVLPHAQVGGGMTSARGGIGGVSPVAWMRAMSAAGAKLDAYAHHPYPTHPQVETPWGPRCGHCSTITMAELDRLHDEVQRNFGSKRIWLTEYGYQTNPPDELLGVSPATQARYVAGAIRRAYVAPRVDLLVFFLVRDDADLDGWQSGFFTASGERKPSHAAFRSPLMQVSRSGSHVTFWGRIRDEEGTPTFRVQVLRDGVWTSVGGPHTAGPNGFFRVTLVARRGTVVRVGSPRVGFSLAVRAE